MDGTGDPDSGRRARRIYPKAKIGTLCPKHAPGGGRERFNVGLSRSASAPNKHPSGDELVMYGEDWDTSTGWDSISL